MSPGTAHLFLCVFFMSLPALGMSRQYDHDASAVLKDGKACFYLGAETTQPGQWAGVEGLSVTVVGDLQEDETLMWQMRMGKAPTIAPATPATCLPYGTNAPGTTGNVALPLKYDRPYAVSLTDKNGRNMLHFCLRRDASGDDYLSKTRFEDRWECAVTPLMAPDDRNFLQRLFDVQPW